MQTNRTLNGSLTFLAESAESAKLVLCGTPRRWLLSTPFLFYPTPINKYSNLINHNISTVPFTRYLLLTPISTWQKAAQKIRDFGTEDVSMLNQSGIQSYFCCGGQQRNFVAWIIFEIIHNKGKYCLTKTVIHSPNMRTTSDDLIIGPVWKEKVGEYDRWNNSPSPKDLDNNHVFLENLKIAKFVYATALDSKATYDAEVGKDSTLKDIAHGNHKTLAKAAKAINNFTRTRVSFLTAKGLVKNLKSVGNLTACRIIHLIKNEGVFEPSTVDWVDLRTKRFSIKHFEGDQ